MFETFNSPAVQVVNQALLSLYASGRATGTVVSIGDGLSTIVPIYDGRILPDDVTRLGTIFFYDNLLSSSSNLLIFPENHSLSNLLELNSHQQTDYLNKLITERGYEHGNAFTPSQSEIVRDLKEKLCYVALDFDAEMQAATNSTTLEKCAPLLLYLCTSD